MENFLVFPKVWLNRNIMMFEITFMQTPKMSHFLLVTCILPNLLWFSQFCSSLYKSTLIPSSKQSCLCWSVLIPVSNSASIVFFPIPPDLSFQQECSPDGLSDCTQPPGLEHGARLHTRSARTKPRVSRGRRNRYPQALSAPLQGRSAVTSSEGC